MIAVENLTYAYGETTAGDDVSPAVDDVSLLLLTLSGKASRDSVHHLAVFTVKAE